MNSLRKSDGKIFQVGGISGFLVLGFLLVGCAQPSVESPSMQERVEQDLNAEVSLKADRDYLSEERKSIPKEIQKANDELAYDLSLMAEIKEDPNRVRQKFQSKVRKLRDNFRNQTQKLRSRFNKAERKRRDSFLKTLTKEREEFKKNKPEREKTKEFYAEQDLRRKEFFAEQKEKRAEFEEEMRSQSKEFHEKMRERGRQLNDQLKIYTQRYREQKRCERDKDCGASAEKSSVPAYKKVNLKEFEEMRKVPGTPLKTQPDDK